MKSISVRNVLCMAVLAFSLIGAGSQLQAEMPREAYRHDRTGYWDSYHHHHSYLVRQGHHGYWWNHLWIRID